MYKDGQPFLAAPFNYALHLNVDWFQPITPTQHSEGAMCQSWCVQSSFVLVVTFQQHERIVGY